MGTAKEPFKLEMSLCSVERWLCSLSFLLYSSSSLSFCVPYACLSKANKRQMTVTMERREKGGVTERAMIKVERRE
jgi:hypothetical protein